MFLAPETFTEKTFLCSSFCFLYIYIHTYINSFLLNLKTVSSLNKPGDKLTYLNVLCSAVNQCLLGMKTLPHALFYNTNVYEKFVVCERFSAVCTCIVMIIFSYYFYNNRNNRLIFKDSYKTTIEELGAKTA